MTRKSKIDLFYEIVICFVAYRNNKNGTFNTTDNVSRIWLLKVKNTKASIPRLNKISPSLYNLNSNAPIPITLVEDYPNKLQPLQLLLA